MTRDGTMSRLGTLILGLYLVALNIGALFALFWMWPASGNEAVTQPVVDAEVEYFIIAITGGMLGTSIAVLTSFATYVGSGGLIASWSWWYIVRPLIGATMGLLTYAAIRGGILKLDQQVDVLNPYAVTALSAAAGLYSKQLVEWLGRRGDEFLSGGMKSEEVRNAVFRSEESQDAADSSEGEW